MYLKLSVGRGHSAVLELFGVPAAVSSSAHDSFLKVSASLCKPWLCSIGFRYKFPEHDYVLMLCSCKFINIFIKCFS